MFVCRLMAFFFDLKCGQLPQWGVYTTDLDCSRTVMQLCPVLEVCSPIPGQGNCFELRFFCKVGSSSDSHFVMPLASLCVYLQTCVFVDLIV